MMRIETERLYLREMAEQDADALLAVFGDPETMQYYPHPFDKENVLNWVDRNIERYRTFGFGLWAMCLKETNEMIGDCGLTMQNIHGVIRPEIGYHVRRDLQRNGYASEAAAAVRNWTFRNTSFRRIYSYMSADNLPSIRTAEAYGCRFLETYADETGKKVSVYFIEK